MFGFRYSDSVKMCSFISNFQRLPRPAIPRKIRKSKGGRVESKREWIGERKGKVEGEGIARDERREKG